MSTTPSRSIPMPWPLTLSIGLVLLVVLAAMVPEPWLHALAVLVALGLALLVQHDRHRLVRIRDAKRATQAREALQAQADEFNREARVARSVLNAVPAPILLIGPEGRVDRINPAGANLLGRSEAETRGCVLEELFPQEDLLTLVDQARSGLPGEARIRLMLDDHPKFFDVTGSPMGPGPAAPVTLCLEDVTTLAESVQLKTDFAANASHELRTPIAAIRGAVETLGIAQDDPEMVTRLSAIITRHAARLEELVKDLLDLSRLESEETPSTHQPVDLASLLNRLEAHSESTRTSRRIGIEFDLEPALHYLETDEGLLELILRNLLENACKFAHPETTVRIVGRAAMISPAAGLNSSGDSRLGPNRGVRLQVIDRGQGIPLKHQARVFERFFQVDPGRDAQQEHRGTGLGLAIVKHAVRRLSGHVDIQSVLQEGTTVTIEIPNCLPDSV